MENENKLHCCYFFGHRKIDKTPQLIILVSESVEDLIVKKSVNTFLFGSKSEFDDLCCKVVTELKEKYPYIRRVYVRAEFPHIDDHYREYLSARYEDTYYPARIIGAGKAVYPERNREMIDNSCYCIFYYDKNNKVPIKKGSHRQQTEHQPQSGTKLAYDYAVKKGIEVINISEKLPIFQ